MLIEKANIDYQSTLHHKRKSRSATAERDVVDKPLLIWSQVLVDSTIGCRERYDIVL